MRVATFNVNSVRARLPVLLRWLEEASPDVVALQELKAEDDKFPRAEVEALGYHVSTYGQKTYNGVGFLTREAPESLEAGLEGEGMLDDKRILRAVVGGVAFVNTYVPNGTKLGSEKFAYKLAWLDKFRRDVEARYRPGDKVVWLGDINVAPTEDDVFEPDRHRGTLGFHPDEVESLERCLEWGWADCFRKFTPGPGHYTFWEYMIPNGFKRNLGWRIDHVYASPALADSCVACSVDKEPRSWERPSDHTPVVAEFQLR
jgi:exodeoxyribonuclease-3